MLEGHLPLSCPSDEAKNPIKNPMVGTITLKTKGEGQRKAK